MRFLPPVAALADGRVEFDGDPHARRPADGARARTPCAPSASTSTTAAAERSRSPSTGRGSVRGGPVTLDASASSQFVSGAAAGRRPLRRGRHRPPRRQAVPSQPHIAMTVETLRDAGVVVDDGEPNTWRVEPSEISALDVLRSSRTSPTPRRSSPPRWSPAAGSRSPTGHSTRPRPATRCATSSTRWAPTSSSTAPASPSPAAGGIERHRRRPPRRQRADPGRRRAGRPRRVPVVDPRHRPHPRPRDRPPRGPRHRDQRASAARSTETDDGLRITPQPLHGGPFHSYARPPDGDGRRGPGPRVPGVVVEDIGTTAKTLPDFTGLWGRMLSADGRGASLMPVSRQHLRRVRRPGPPEPAGLAASHQGPARPRGRRARRCVTGVDRGRYTTCSSDGRQTAPSGSIIAMRARELGPQGRRRRRRGGPRRRHHRRPDAASPASSASSRASRAAPHRRRHRPGRAGHRRQRRPARRRLRPGQPRAPPAADRPLPRRRLRRRAWSPCSCSPRPTSPTRRRSSQQYATAGGPPRRDPPRHDGTTDGLGRRCASALVGPGQRARRSLRRRQVARWSTRLVPDAERAVGRRQRRHRPGPAHLVLGGRAAAARRRRLGHRHPRHRGPSGSPTSTSRGSSSIFPDLEPGHRRVPARLHARRGGVRARRLGRDRRRRPGGPVTARLPAPPAARASRRGRVSGRVNRPP